MAGVFRSVSRNVNCAAVRVWHAYTEPNRGVSGGQSHALVVTARIAPVFGASPRRASNDRVAGTPRADAGA